MKKLGFNLNKSNFRSGKVQLREYLHSIGGVKWGLLSNGYEWRLYDFSTQTSGGVEVLCFDLLNDSESKIELEPISAIENTAAQGAKPSNEINVRKA